MNQVVPRLHSEQHFRTAAERQIDSDREISGDRRARVADFGQFVRINV